VTTAIGYLEMAAVLTAPWRPAVTAFTILQRSATQAEIHKRAMEMDTAQFHNVAMDIRIQISYHSGQHCQNSVIKAASTRWIAMAITMAMTDREVVGLHYVATVIQIHNLCHLAQ
jgi:hypothetical protein